MYKNPLVSIITPCYNAEKYIEKAIESVLNQTYTAWEMIIVDDKSIDSSLEIIEKYALQDKRIKVLYHDSNYGVAKSRNSALCQATGKYISFLDSDDIWFSNKLEKQIYFMENNAISVSYSAYNVIDRQGEKIGYFSIKEQISYHNLLKTSTIGTLTLVYNAEILGKYYLLNMGHEDYVMKLALLKEAKIAYGLNEPLASYRIWDKSLSHNKIKAALWQWYIYRKVENLSLLKSIYYFIHYAYYGFRKYKD